MQEATLNPTLTSEPAEGLEAAALRAQDWYGEPFLHPDEEPAAALAPGTARRSALDEALVEMEAGLRAPSTRWRVRYGFMLGLERVLASPTPTTASGTEPAPPPDRRARRHAHRADRGEPARRGGERQRQRQRPRQRRRRRDRPCGARRGGRRLRRGRDRGRARGAVVHRRGSRRVTPLPLPPPDGVRQDDRRSRVRRVRPPPRHPDPHPPPPARLAVPARPDDRGLRGALHRRDRPGQGAAARRPDHDPDVRLVCAPRGRDLPRARTSS